MGVDRVIDITNEEREVVLDLLHRHLPGVEAWVYGSRAKWTSRPQSDLDLVVFATLEQSRRVGDLREAFEESNLPFRVDLFVWSEVPEVFHKQIEKEHLVLVVKGQVVSKELESAWHSNTWGDLATLEYGKALRDYRSSEGSYRVFGTNGPIGWHTEALYEGPSVIVGRKGAYRGIHYAPDPFFVIDTAFYLRSKTQLDTRWAYYELLSQDINGLDSGSAIPSTRREAFYSLQVKVPPISEQRAIAHILGTLDDKFELNRRMNETLEAMARALFKSWFVDFDPVRAKMALKQHATNHSPLERKSEKQGHQPAGAPMEGNTLTRNYQVAEAGAPPPHQPSPDGSASATPPQWGGDWTAERARAYLDNMRPEIVDLFLDRLVDSELGEIPEGWEIGRLADIASSPRRGVNPTTLSTGTPYIGLEHMPRRSVALTEWESARKVTSNKAIFMKGEFLFGKLRPYFHKVGFAPLDGICSTDIVVIAPRTPDWAAYLLACLSSEEFVNYTDQTSTGTRMPRTSWKAMKQYRIFVPPEPVVHAFQRIVQVFYDRISTKIHENVALAQSRDTLLPKLISGKIRLRDAEKAVEAIA